jgi:hypothetical protein
LVNAGVVRGGFDGLARLIGMVKLLVKELKGRQASVKLVQRNEHKLAPAHVDGATKDAETRLGRCKRDLLSGGYHPPARSLRHYDFRTRRAEGGARRRETTAVMADARRGLSV